MLGGIERREKTEALCRGGRVRRAGGRPAPEAVDRDAVVLHWFWMGREVLLSIQPIGLCSWRHTAPETRPAVQ